MAAMLNTLWLSFFLLAFVAALWQWLSGTNPEVFSQLVAATFEMSNLAVEIAIGLIGVMALWLGLFKIAEHSGLIDIIARAMGPLFSRLMPEVPPNHPAIGSVTMNLAANFLGLDNAATPMGLKAMNDLQELNPDKDTATNAQILFLVLNTSSVTLLPVTIFLYRAQQGSTEPAAVFLPILMATSASTLVGLFSVAWLQKLRLHDPVVLAWFGGFAVLMAALLSFIVGLPGDILSSRSALIGNLLLFSVIVLFLVSGIQRRLDCYSLFIEGAKEGFNVAIKIIPFLLAMLVGDRRIPRQRLSRHPSRRHSRTGLCARCRHPLRRCPADSLHEAAQWQRRAGDDAGDHEHFRCGLLCRPHGGDDSGQHRDYFLRAGGLLWQRWYPQDPPCDQLRPAGRLCRHHDGDFCELLVLRLSASSQLNCAFREIVVSSGGVEDH
jgi:spore maturation protein SpmA